MYIYVYIYISGWWFGTFGLFFHILESSSSQLTFIFFRGVETTNHIYIYTYIYIDISYITI